MRQAKFAMHNATPSMDLTVQILRENGPERRPSYVV